MAFRGPLSRVVRIMPSAGTQMKLNRYLSSIEIKNDSCSRLRSLGMTPLEASLSAQIVTSLKFSQYKIQDVRLPTSKPISITLPTLHKGELLEKGFPPVISNIEKIEPSITHKISEEPSNQVTEKQAARLIVIRRRKMRKHKLKKLRKKMKFIWLKVRQRREYRKEKDFQAGEMAKVREFEAFNAAEYVADIIAKAKEASKLKKTY